MSSSSDQSEDWRTREDDDFRGVKQKRSCTDCYCLVVLVVFIACWVGVAYYAFWNGDIHRLMAPKDSMGRTCGVDEDVREKPFLFFFDISKCVSLSVFIYGCPTKQICIKECPKETWDSTEVFASSSIMWNQVQKKLICNDTTIIKTINSLEALNKTIQERKCAPYYFQSVAALSKMCLPSLGILPTSVTIKVMEGSGKKADNYFSYVYEISSIIAEDLRRCWHFIVLFISVSMLCCLFIIIIMGIITKIVIWSILTLILIFLSYSTAITYLQYYSMTESSHVNDTLSPSYDFYTETAYGQVQTMFKQKETWFVLFVVSATFFTLFFLLIVFLRSRIELAVMLIGEGSKAINAVKSTLCLPFVIRILQLAVIFWFLVIGCYIRSLGNSVYVVKGLNGTDADCVCKTYKEDSWCLPHKFEEECHSKLNGGPCMFAKCSFEEHRDPQLKTYMQMYNLFGLLWGLYFVSGLGQIILSFCFASWYWTYNKYDLKFFTLLHSVYVTLRYHLGTVALGSFLIATCGFIRTILEHTQRILKQSDGLLTQCMTWSMRGCFWFLQKFLVFISKNAYIMCSITGYGFFSASGQALGLLARNVVRAVVLDKVLDFLLLIGKLSISLFMGFLSYYTFGRDSLHLTYPWVPTIIVVLFTWIVASSFFKVYEVAVDTLFLSFLKDGELNDGSHSKPYYMSSKLRYIMSKSTKVRKR